MEELGKLQQALDFKTEDQCSNNGSCRLSLYKARKDPKNQHDRRILLLQNHKKSRLETFQKLRGITGDTQETKQVNRTFVSEKFRDLLMLSEWLEDVPDELEEDWFSVICPVGKRCLVVASHGKTAAYSRAGWFLASHPSLLPHGQRHPESGRTRSSVTLLDCIYSEIMETYFVLDILIWNGHSVAECDTEFRFCWLSSNLLEIQGLNIRSRMNPYPIVAAPSCAYTADTLGEQIITLEKRWGAANVDGVLFYHRKIPYIAGPTPLVGWLKPYMLPERLNLPVPATLANLKPSDYTNFVEYLKVHSEDYKKERLKREKRFKSTLESRDDVDMSVDDLDGNDKTKQVAASSFSQWR